MSSCIVGLFMPFTNDIFIKVFVAGSKMPKTEKPIYSIVFGFGMSQNIDENNHNNNTIKRQAAGDKGIELNGFSNNEQSNIEIYGFAYAVLSKATKSENTCMLFAGLHLIRYDGPLCRCPMFNVIVLYEWKLIDAKIA